MDTVLSFLISALREASKSAAAESRSSAAFKAAIEAEGWLECASPIRLSAYVAPQLSITVTSNHRHPYGPCTRAHAMPPLECPEGVNPTLKPVCMDENILATTVM
jgi:CxxC motif-containing protein (DUF1111 family)